MTQTFVVTGAGPVGWTVTEQLADAGHHVKVLTRSGSGPDRPEIERLSADASDPEELGAAVAGAAAVFHCIHGSAYAAKTWREELPGAERVVMDAAGAAGAVVVFPESLYSYVDTTRAMTEDNARHRTGGKSEVRTELLDRRAAHPTPTVSVVASDFVGPRVLTSHMGDRILKPVLAGKKVRVLGSLDQPHSWTYVPDLARAMVAAAQRPELWDQVLHAPTAGPRSQREMVHAFADAAGVAIPEPGLVPSWAMRGIGLVHPGTRELAEMLYQFENPFVMDSRRSQERLGFGPTPTDVQAKETVAWWSARTRAREGATGHEG